MDLRGKRIVFLGDSITEGYGTSSVDNVYWKVLERNTGAHCFGYGIGGTRIARQQKPESLANDNWFGSRVDSMIPDADIVIVFGGINDFCTGEALLGTQADRTEDTFCGALHVLMEKLINRYPSATIIFMTPMHGGHLEDDITYNSAGSPRFGNLQMYVDAVIEAAAYYSIPVLDMYRTGGIIPRIEVVRQKFVPDGIHPNDAGQARIAQRLQGFLGSL